MTFLDLKKKVLQNQQLQQTTRLSDLLANKPFWIWDTKEHIKADLETKGQCCFNHIVGLPKKEDIEKPIFDYQKLIYDSLLVKEVNNPLNHNFKHKHLWIKKATGLGVTEFFLRLMCWLCLKDNTYRGAQMCIVTGPNIDISIKLIKRMKALFETKLKMTFANKETVLELNGCTIEAYPSNHLDAYRALDNPKFILIDEADFFRKGEQEDVRHVSERYIAKSDPFIVMVSTPNAPGGLFERMEQENEETCIYKRLKMDFTYGLGKIYKEEEIENAKSSPSFEREYNLKYLGLIGNVFHTQQIDRAIEKGSQYDPDNINKYAKKSMGIDPGFGSSPFGICITQFSDQQVQVLYAEEFERPDFNEMIDKVAHLASKYGFSINSGSKIFVDGANPSVIRGLKDRIGEDPNYENLIQQYKSNHVTNWEKLMLVVPVNFNQEHKKMLLHSKQLLEEDHISINKKFDKLITSLRTAVENEGSLDKETTSFNDIFDAYRLALRYFVIK